MAAPSFQTGVYEVDLMRNMKEWLDENITDIYYNGTEIPKVYIAQPHKFTSYPAIFVYCTSTPSGEIHTYPGVNPSKAIKLSLNVDLFLRDTYSDITIRTAAWANAVRTVVDGDVDGEVNHWRIETAGCPYLLSHSYPTVEFHPEIASELIDDDDERDWGAATITFEGVKLLDGS